MNMQSQSFSAGKIACHQNWLLEIAFTKQAEITLFDMHEITAFREMTFGDTPYCSLIDAKTDFLTMNAEAKEFSATNAKINELRVAEAILVQSLGQMLGASLYLRLFKSKSQRRVFKNRESAINWLERKYKNAIQESVSQQ